MKMSELLYRMPFQSASEAQNNGSCKNLNQALRHFAMGSSFKATTKMVVPFRLCPPTIHTESTKNSQTPYQKRKKKKKKNKRQTYSTKNQSLPTFSFFSFSHSNLYTSLCILTKCWERERDGCETALFLGLMNGGLKPVLLKRRWQFNYTMSNK
jgi:hypothetical protein